MGSVHSPWSSMTLQQPCVNSMLLQALNWWPRDPLRPTCSVPGRPRVHLHPAQPRGRPARVRDCFGEVVSRAHGRWDGQAGIGWAGLDLAWSAWHVCGCGCGCVVCGWGEEWWWWWWCVEGGVLRSIVAFVITLLL